VGGLAAGSPLFSSQTNENPGNHTNLHPSFDDFPKRQVKIHEMTRIYTKVS
jgi:hypothetical protein